MNYTLLNIAYGTGPYLRTTELALNVNDNKVIVPLLYGDKQKNIMKEELGTTMDRIVLDEMYGSLLKELLYRNESYESFLRRWLAHVEPVSVSINEHIQKTYGDAITLHLARSPLAQIDVAPAFNVSFAKISEILSKAIGIADIAVEDELLAEAAKKMKEIESSFTHFIAVPGTLNTGSIPPTMHEPVIDTAPMEDGVYVSVTGIPGRETLFKSLENLGRKIYTNKPDVFQNAEYAPPSVIGNPAVKLQVARSGWSAVWRSLLTTTPLILTPYDPSDDPEIYFNNQILEQLGIGMVFKGQSLEELEEAGNAIRSRMEAYNNELKNRFGILDGITYLAQKIR